MLETGPQKIGWSRGWPNLILVWIDRAQRAGLPDSIVGVLRPQWRSKEREEKAGFYLILNLNVKKCWIRCARNNWDSNKILVRISSLILKLWNCFEGEC